MFLMYSFLAFMFAVSVYYVCVYGPSARVKWMIDWLIDDDCCVQSMSSAEKKEWYKHAYNVLHRPAAHELR